MDISTILLLSCIDRVMKTVFENPVDSYISCTYTKYQLQKPSLSAKIWPVDVYKKQSMIDLDIAKQCRVRESENRTCST